MKKLCVFFIIMSFFLVACKTKPAFEKNVEALKAANLETAQIDENGGNKKLEDVQAYQTKENTNQNTYEVGLKPEKENKKLKAIDELVEIVYYHRDKNLIAPFILLNSEDAKNVNKEIEQRVLKMAGNGEKMGHLFMTYRVLLNRNILSVLIQMDEDAKIDFVSYNFDIESGRKLSIDEVLAVAGLNWKLAESIFQAERKAYWRGIKQITKEEETEYQVTLDYEMENLRDFYESKEIPIILDEDGLANIVCVLLDEEKEKYWQLFCLSTNRTVLLQRNVYGGEFSAVVIAEPSDEEISNLKIVKKIETPDNGQQLRNTFLILPLWENLDFYWKKSSKIESRDLKGMEILDEIYNLVGGDAIFIEMNAEEVTEESFQGIIKQGKDNVVFSVAMLQKIPKEENGMLYLTLD